MKCELTITTYDDKDTITVSGKTNMDLFMFAVREMWYRKGLSREEKEKYTTMLMEDKK